MPDVEFSIMYPFKVNVIFLYDSSFTNSSVLAEFGFGLEFDAVLEFEPEVGAGAGLEFELEVVLA